MSIGTRKLDRQAFHAYMERFIATMNFRDVRRMRDLGKSIRWPAPPLVLAQFVSRLRVMHQRWRAATILARMPPHLRASLPQKIAAFEVLNNKKENWGYTRMWRGDYLSQVGVGRLFQCLFL